jgi:hypothetical protein
MPTSQAYRIVFDAAKLEHELEMWVSKAVATVPWVGLVYEGKISQITSVYQLLQTAKDWPHWPTLPWIIVGAKSAPSALRTYSRPFLENRPSTEYEPQVQALIDDFDWALFTYFTTYQHAILTWVSRSSIADAGSPAIHGPGVTLDHYTEGAQCLQTLRNATFYDYGIEGWLAYTRAIESREGAPYLLCRIDPDHPEYYWIHDYESDSIIETIWFAEHIAQLELVEEFDFESDVFEYIGRAPLKLYRAINEEAYCAIWAEASRGWSIAEATFSADCDIAKLKATLGASPYWFDSLRDTDDVASWVYRQIYGGGADEHHAIFRARDARITHEICMLAGDAGVSRF